jgi:hypothetical protein
VNCTLTLLSNKIRIDGNAQKDYIEVEEDSRFISNFAAMESIATSHAQNDSGMFELNFRDERYLPFEGAGAISRWRLDMPKDCNTFDFDTIADVVLKLNYMARDGGDLLRGKAKVAVKELQEAGPLVRFFSAKHEFPSEWHRFLNPIPSETSQDLQLSLMPERFPFQFRGKVIMCSECRLFLKLKDNVEYPGTGVPLTLFLTPPSGQSAEPALLESTPSFVNGVPYAAVEVSSIATGTWVIGTQQDNLQQATAVSKPVTATVYRLNPDVIKDLWIVCKYAINS